MLQRPQLALLGRGLERLNRDLDSLLVRLLSEGQDMHHAWVIGEPPVCDSDGNLAGSEGGRVESDAPAEVFTPGDGGDSKVGEFCESEIAAGDSAAACYVGHLEEG